MKHEERVARLRFLTPWIERCRAILWLNHHECKIQHAPPDNDSNASIFRPHDRLAFTLWFSDDFLLDTPTQQRQTLAHELFHLYFGPLWDVIRAVEDQLGKPAYLAWTNALQSAEERVVDEFAWPLAALLPLPPVYGDGPTEQASEFSPPDTPGETPDS